MNQDKIGKFIYELRKEKNFSQYQLADIIPISRQAVSKWERGKTIPDHQTLLRLSEIFDVSINELLTGERLSNNSIEALEETALSILDQSTKKTKMIKRITTISISIITILLLAFLSYYFINSYNTMEVYRIGNTNKEFTTADGIYITTREKYYFKLGKIKNKIGANINNIGLYYKKDNKEILLVEDEEADNIVIMDSYGYGSKFTKKDIKDIKENLYLKINYNDTEEVWIKLRYKRDFKNSSLFFLKQHKESHKIEPKEELTEIKEENPEVKEEHKEEVKPTIKETTEDSKKTNNKVNNETPKEETKKEETRKEESKKDEPQPEEQKKEEPQPEEKQSEETQPEEVVITTEMVINKIKEVCTDVGGTYTCNYDTNTTIMYHSIMNKITLYSNGNLAGHYMVNANSYMCFIDDCETVFNETYKTYLFS